MNPVNISDTDGDNLTIEEYGGDLHFEADANLMVYDRPAVESIRNACNEFLGPEFDWGSKIGANEAKLRLAAEYGLKAKFAYTGERDYRAVERRIVPEDVYVNHDHVLVGGESFDQGGIPEGYRQFRLDRISGEVVVR